ncbi:Insertion element IS2A protein [Escherichia coli]|nr:Insertion element IS2A protein [Escherichia coli]CTV26947.1 Insertion element IS2A protein [Escherichia coli]CTV67237.1 Insertion element IS2A protein [Escherichia coli]CTV86128.1 Insertion element IS2A protein [Escherichia coli]CTW71481.1 Insertion element IS2A protein [Escherichia coli]
MIDVLGPEKRRRRTTQEKIAIVQQSFEPGMTVSLVARQHGVAASQLFLWRKQYQEGSLTAVAAGEQVVPASELAAAVRSCTSFSDEPMTGKMVAAVVTQMIWMHFSVYTMLSDSCPRLVIVGYGLCFADRPNLMVCLRSMPNVFTGSCARMRCCLSEKPLYRHRSGHILAKWP